MAKDPAFLFYPGDYLRDTQTMSEKTQVAYDRIMCEHMRNICIRQAQLKFFTKRLNEEEKEELMHVLTQTDGGFQITWVAESIVKRRAYSESRRNNRLKKPNNISKTYVNHMENENENENINKIEVEIWPTFENFWIAYEKKVGKKSKIESKWNKLSQSTKEDIMQHIDVYKKSQPDKRYRKNPEAYLNNESWNDEIINATTPSKMGNVVESLKRKHGINT